MLGNGADCLPVCKFRLLTSLDALPMSWEELRIGLMTDDANSLSNASLGYGAERHLYRQVRDKVAEAFQKHLENDNFFAD